MTNDLRELFMQHATLVAGAEFCEKFDFDAIAAQIEQREAAAVEAAREECACICEAMAVEPMFKWQDPVLEAECARRIRALNVTGALDRVLNQARRVTMDALARWLLHKDDCAKCSGQTCTCGLDQRIVELEARPGQR